MKPTFEEYIKAKEIVNAYEKQEFYEEEVPLLIGYLNTRIAYNGYEVCLSGHSVYELNDRYFIEMEPIKGSKMLPCRQKFYKKDLAPCIEFIDR